MSAIEAKLKELGITLPEAVMPAANYVPYSVSGNHVFISGQLPMKDGKPLFVGKLGDNVTMEQGQETARLCAYYILTHLRAACGGNLDRVTRCLRLGVFVNSTEAYTDHPKVANGASDLMVQIFGEKGKHARFAVGVSQLPFGAAVEVDATFEIA